MSDRIGPGQSPRPNEEIGRWPIDQTIDWRGKMNPFFYRLTLAHSRLDAEIRREQKRRAPDPFRLLELKKLKLAVKDRLHRFLRSRPEGMA